MESLKVIINIKLWDFSIIFATFNFLTKIGEKNAHLFPEREKEENSCSSFLKEKKERNNNNEEGVLDYSLIKKGLRKSWCPQAGYLRVSK